MSPRASAVRTTQDLRTQRSVEVGDPTLRFFLEGEEMEETARRSDFERAQGFGNDNHGQEPRRDTLTLLEAPESPLDRYERHARVRGTLIALALLTSLGAIGVAGWIFLTTPGQPAVAWLRSRVPALMAFLKADDQSDVPASQSESRAANRATEAEVAVPPAAPPVAETTAPAPAVAEPAAAPVASVQPASTAAAVEKGTAAAPQVPARSPVIEPLAPAKPAKPSDEATTAAAPARSARGTALRGYVWSPAAKALVTSEASAAATAPAVAPAAAKERSSATDDSAAASVGSPTTPAITGSMPAGPGIAAPSTGPAPDETARVPGTEPPPVQPAPLPSKTADSPAAPIID